MGGRRPILSSPSRGTNDGMKTGLDLCGLRSRVVLCTNEDDLDEVVLSIPARRLEDKRHTLSNDLQAGLFGHLSSCRRCSRLAWPRCPPGRTQMLVSRVRRHSRIAFARMTMTAQRRFTGSRTSITDHLSDSNWQESSTARRFRYSLGVARTVSKQPGPPHGRRGARECLGTTVPTDWSHDHLRISTNA